MKKGSMIFITKDVYLGGNGSGIKVVSVQFIEDVTKGVLHK